MTALAKPFIGGPEPVACLQVKLVFSLALIICELRSVSTLCDSNCCSF